VLVRWDALTARRPVVALAAADAHARLGLPDRGEPYTGPASLLRVPGYEQVFRAMSIALDGVELSGDAEADARAVAGAIREGRVYSSIDGLAAPAHFEFRADRGSGQIAMGRVVHAAGPITFRAATNAPDATITLIKDGDPIASAKAALERAERGDPGVYRVEVHVPAAPGEPPVAWILSNPIYVRPSSAPTVLPDPWGPATEFSTIYGDGAAAGWIVEHSPRSQAEIDVVAALGGTQLLLRYALGGALSESPFAAFVVPAGPALSGFDRIVFTAHASRPMRMSVQLRIPEGGGERWRRSIYLDETPREISVVFDEMTPVGRTSRRRPELSKVEGILFVVDTVNTPAGMRGEIYLDDLRYAR
jgi:hypothetical protein